MNVNRAYKQHLPSNEKQAQNENKNKTNQKVKKETATATATATTVTVTAIVVQRYTRDNIYYVVSINDSNKQLFSEFVHFFLFLVLLLSPIDTYLYVYSILLFMGVHFVFTY